MLGKWHTEPRYEIQLTKSPIWETAKGIMGITYTFA